MNIIECKRKCSKEVRIVAHNFISVQHKYTKRGNSGFVTLCSHCGLFKSDFKNGLCKFSYSDKVCFLILVYVYLNEQKVTPVYICVKCERCYAQQLPWNCTSNKVIDMEEVIILPTEKHKGVYSVPQIISPLLRTVTVEDPYYVGQ